MSRFKQFTTFPMGLVTLLILKPSALPLYVSNQDLVTRGQIAVAVLPLIVIILGSLGALWLVWRLFRTLSDWAHDRRSLNEDSAATLTLPAQAEPLSPVCPKCGTMNLPGHRFCSNCGSTLSFVT